MIFHKYVLDCSKEDMMKITKDGRPFQDEKAVLENI